MTTKPKDAWDKGDVICKGISGIGVALIAAVGLVASYMYETQQQEMRAAQSKLQEMELFEKFLPRLEMGGDQQRTALLSIRDIAGLSVAIRYARIHGGQGTLDALVIMQQEATIAVDRAQIRDAFAYLMRRDPGLAQVSSGIVVPRERIRQSYSQETRVRTVPVTRMVTEERTRIATVNKYRPVERTRIVEFKNPETGEMETKTEVYQVQVPYVEQIEQTYTVDVPVTEEIEETYTVRVPVTQVYTADMVEYEDPNIGQIASSLVEAQDLNFDQLVALVAERVGATPGAQRTNLRRRLSLLVVPSSASANLTETITSVDEENQLLPSVVEFEQARPGQPSEAASVTAPSVFPGQTGISTELGPSEIASESPGLTDGSGTLSESDIPPAPPAPPE